MVDNLENILKEDCQYFIRTAEESSLNRETICKRALAIADPPIKFSYDVGNANCETMFTVVALGIWDQCTIQGDSVYQPYKDKAKRMLGKFVETVQANPGHEDLRFIIRTKLVTAGLLFEVDTAPSVQADDPSSEDPSPSTHLVGQMASGNATPSTHLGKHPLPEQGQTVIPHPGGVQPPPDEPISSGPSTLHPMTSVTASGGNVPPHGQSMMFPSGAMQHMPNQPMSSGPPSVHPIGPMTTSGGNLQPHGQSVLPSLDVTHPMSSGPPPVHTMTPITASGGNLQPYSVIPPSDAIQPHPNQQMSSVTLPVGTMIPTTASGGNFPIQGAPVLHAPGAQVLHTPRAPVLHAPGAQVLHPPGAPVLHTPGAPVLHTPGAQVLHAPGAQVLHPPGAPVLHAPGAQVLHAPGAPVLHAPVVIPPPSTIQHIDHCDRIEALTNETHYHGPVYIIGKSEPPIPTDSVPIDAPVETGNFDKKCQGHGDGEVKKDTVTFSKGNITEEDILNYKVETGFISKFKKRLHSTKSNEDLNRIKLSAKAVEDFAKTVLPRHEIKPIPKPEELGGVTLQNAYTLLGKTVDLWTEREQEMATVQVLLSSLELSGIDDLTVELKEHVKDCLCDLPPKPVAQIPENLRTLVEIYKSNLAEQKKVVVQVLPFMVIQEAPESFQKIKDLEHLYIPRTYKNVDTGEEVTSLEKLFCNSRRVTLIKGAPGIGKSFLFEWFLLSWARGQEIQRFPLVMSFNCRSLKGEALGGLADISFHFSCMSLDASQTMELTFEDLKNIGNDGGLTVGLDGLDEIDLPTNQQEITRILLKVKQAHEDSTIKLSGRDYVVGLLYNRTLPKAYIITFGRNNAIDFIRDLNFTRKNKEDELRLFSAKMKLPQETKTCGANIFEILPFKDDDVKTFAHNILNCDHDEDMNDDSSPVEGGITHLCDKVDSIIRYMKDLGELRLNPCICRYLCEISGFRVRKGQDFGEEVKNFTLVMTDLICCRLRDHTGIDHEEILNISNLPKNLVKGLQTISTVSFHAILAGDIEMRGNWMNNEDNSDIIVEVYSHHILLSTLKALGLFKLYKDPHGGIVLEPEHLVVQEYLAGSHMANMDIEKMRENFLKIPLDRRVMLCMFTAGLQANNKLVHSFMKLLHGDWQTKGSSSVIFPMILSLPDEEVPIVPDQEFMDINIDVQSNASFLSILSFWPKTTQFSKRKQSFLSALVKESEHRISWSLMSDFISKNLSSSNAADLKLSISSDPQVTQDSSQIHEVVYTVAPFKSTVQQHIASLTWMENNISDVTYKYKPKTPKPEDKFIKDFLTLVDDGQKKMPDKEIDDLYINFMEMSEDQIPQTADTSYQNISFVDTSNNNEELFLSGKRQGMMALLTKGSGKKLPRNILHCLKYKQPNTQDKIKVFVSFNETDNISTCHISIGDDVKYGFTKVETANDYSQICNTVGLVEWMKETMDVSHVSFSVDNLHCYRTIPANLATKFAVVAANTKDLYMHDTKVAGDVWRSLANVPAQSGDIGREVFLLSRVEMGDQLDAAAGYLAGVKCVILTDTKVTSPLLRALTSSIKTRRQNEEYVVEEVRLWRVDLSGAEADAVAEFLSSVKCVQLRYTKVTSPLLRALTSSIKTRRQNEEHVMEEVELWRVDLSGAEADAVAEFITNIKSMKLTDSTHLSTEQWESTARLQERKAIAGECVLEKLVTGESNEFVDRIKMKIL